MTATTHQGLLPGAPMPTGTGLTPAGLTQLPGRTTQNIINARHFFSYICLHGYGSENDLSLMVEQIPSRAKWHRSSKPPVPRAQPDCPHAIRVTRSGQVTSGEHYVKVVANNGPHRPHAMASAGGGALCGNVDRAF